jgi:hypothetical protein
MKLVLHCHQSILHNEPLDQVMDADISRDLQQAPICILIFKTQVILHPQPSSLYLQLQHLTDSQMRNSLDNVLTLDSPSTTSPSSAGPGDQPSVPHYATWRDLVDDYYRMSPLSPEDSSDLLPPALQESQLSHSVRIQLLQDSQIALDLLFEDAQTDNCMSKGFSVPSYSPEGYLAPLPDYVPFSPEGYINEPPIHFLPAYHCLPHPPTFTPQFYHSSFGLSCSMTSVGPQGGPYNDWTFPSSLSWNLGAFVPSAGPCLSRTTSPTNKLSTSRSCTPTEDGEVERASRSS